MKNSKKLIVTAGVISVGMMAAAASATPVPPASSFGTLSYPSGTGSTEIPFQWPGSLLYDNTNFVYTNTNIGSGGTSEWLTIGLRAHAYYGAPNTTPAYVGNNTFQADAGSSLWTPGSGTPPPDYANAPRWGFSWSISVDGSRVAPQTNGLFWSMRIVGPGTTGNWGTTQFGGAVDSAAALNAWQLGFSYFALNSASTPNVMTPGLWDGLNFNPNTLGDYQFTIAVRDGSYNGAIVGQTSMVVSVVPAPGALALLGVAGLAGGRRRRA